MDSLQRFADLFDDEIKRWDATGTGHPSKAEVEAVGSRLGVALPEDYVEFQCTYGALHVEVLEEIWPRPTIGHGAPFWTMLYGFSVIGVGEGAPEWLDIEEVTRTWREEHRELGFTNLDGIVPFFSYVDNADFACFTEQGGIVEWSHEVPDGFEHHQGTFGEYVVEKLSDLVAYKRAIAEAVRNHGDSWASEAKYPL
jgi:hypothetical protein